MAITVTLTGTILVTDNLTGSVQLQKAVLGSFSGTISEIAQGQLIGTGSTTIALPVNPTQFVYLKNLSTTATVTVTWTPTGGASATIDTLQPGGLMILSESNTTSGISALSVTASAASTPIEYALVG